jgi:hypothetical protein
MLHAEQQLFVHETNLQLLGLNIKQQQFAWSLNGGRH